MVWIEGGTFMMGSNDFYPEEAPAHEVAVDGFFIDKYPVINRQFARFVRETNYVTFSERYPPPEDYPDAQPEMLVPGSLVFDNPGHRVDLNNYSNWWTFRAGANWRHPEGPGSSLKG